MKRLLCAHVCMHVCVRLSHFYINLYISFIYEDIFAKFAENVYGCENMSVKKSCPHLKKTKHGSHSRLIENQ